MMRKKTGREGDNFGVPRLGTFSAARGTNPPSPSGSLTRPEEGDEGSTQGAAHTSDISQQAGSEEATAGTSTSSHRGRLR